MFPARRIAPHIGVVVLILTLDTVAAALLLDFFDASARIGYVLTGSVTGRDLFVLVVPVAAAMSQTLWCPVAATLVAIGAPRGPVIGAAAAGVAAAGSAVLAVILARHAAFGPAGSSRHLLVGAIAFLLVNVVAIVLLRAVGESRLFPASPAPTSPWSGREAQPVAVAELRVPVRAGPADDCGWP